MILMHWVGMVPIIALLTLYLHGPDGLKWYLQYLKQQKFIPNGWIGVILFLAGTTGTIAAYMLASCKTAQWPMCVGRVNENVAEYGFHEAPAWVIIACAVYFPSVNPLIEELFWRVFMNREVEVIQEDGLRQCDEEEAILPEKDISASIVVPKPAPLPIPIRVLFSMLYASYHTIVVGVFLGDVKYGVMSFFVIGLLGYLLQHILHTLGPTRGFSAVVFLHVGMDLGVIVALADSLGWIHLL